MTLRTTLCEMAGGDTLSWLPMNQGRPPGRWGREKLAWRDGVEMLFLDMAWIVSVPGGEGPDISGEGGCPRAQSREEQGLSQVSMNLERHLKGSILMPEKDRTEAQWKLQKHFLKAVS